MANEVFKVLPGSEEKATDMPYGGYDFSKPSLAVIASANGRGVVLWHVGGHVAVEFDGGDMAAEDVGLEPPDDGIWIWEGKLEGGSGPTWYNPDGTDATLEGKFREATDEEWASIRESECPWDDTEWMLCLCERGGGCPKHEAVRESTDALGRNKCPKPCVECEDGDHHWLDQATDDDGNPVDPFFACKHCDATAGMCAECLQPNLIADAALCTECNAELEN
jgi:hypothetical protein